MNHFLSKNILLLFILNIAPSLARNCNIPDKYALSYEFNGYCYVKVTRQHYYIGAERYCHSIGAHLVSIHSEAERNLLNKHFYSGNYFWIGLNDERREGQWEWTDGTPFDYRNWTFGEPVNDDDKNCVFTYPTGGWGVGACAGEFKRFFCKYKVNENPKPILGKPALPVAAPPIGGAVKQADGVPPICRGSWTFNGYCYKLSDVTARSFTGAERQCQRMGGHLVSIHSQAEQTFLNRKIHSEYWIGLNDRQREGRWEWTDGSRLDHRYWSRGERNNDDHKNCVLADDSGRWGLDACAGPRRYMCKTQMPVGFQPGPEPVQPKPVRPEPAQAVAGTQGNCSGGWIFNGFCYKHIKTKDPIGYFVGAERYCQRTGGHLPSVHSDAEQKLLNKIIPGHSFWIGLNDERREGEWEWTDGTPYYYRHWSSDQPSSDDNENCVSTLSNGRWAVGECTAGSKLVVCKYSLNGKRKPILDKPALPNPTPVIRGMENQAGSSSPICTGGWKFNGNCYKMGGFGSFTGGERHCQRMGGHLVSIHSQAEHKFLLSKTRKNYWIGLHDWQRRAQWAWTDGSRLDYRHWGADFLESSTKDDVSNCARAGDDNAVWYAPLCGERALYMCKTGIVSSVQPKPVQPKLAPAKAQARPETPDNNGAVDYSDYGPLYYKWRL